MEWKYSSGLCFTRVAHGLESICPMYRYVSAGTEASWIKLKVFTAMVAVTRNIVLKLANGEFLSEMRDSNEHYVA